MGEEGALSLRSLAEILWWYRQKKEKRRGLEIQIGGVERLAQGTYQADTDCDQNACCPLMSLVIHGYGRWVK